MKTQTIEVEGLPEGYRAVAYRKPIDTDLVFLDGRVVTGNMVNQGYEWLIIEKIQPRRISFDEDALNTAGWAIFEKYNEIVGEGMGGRLFNNLKPLLKIGISEYFRLAEAKETNEDHYLKLTKKDMLELIEHIKLGGQLNPKIAEFIKENS